MATRQRQVTATVATPAGTVTVAARSPAEAEMLRARVERALAGAADDFADVPIPDGTPFQQACWDACRGIPRGDTRTYAWLAAAAGSPRALRAAGQAMRRNPMPVVVPCHRVVGTGTWIGGYSGSARGDGPELSLKRWLLDLERTSTDVPSLPRR